MIQDEQINGMVFLQQTTYYIYRNEEDRKNDRAFLCTSSKKTFDMYREKALDGTWKLKVIDEEAK